MGTHTLTCVRAHTHTHTHTYSLTHTHTHTHIFRSDVKAFMPEFLIKRYKKEKKVEEKVRETFERFHELNVDDSHYVNKFLEVYEKDKMCGRHIFPLKQV